MSTVMEIEAALKELPLQDARAIAHWLRTYLEKSAAVAQNEQDSAEKLRDSAEIERTESPKTKPALKTPVKLPDYAASDQERW
jgi:hypothetical protein